MYMVELYIILLIDVNCLVPIVRKIDGTHKTWYSIL